VSAECRPEGEMAPQTIALPHVAGRALFSPRNQLHKPRHPNGSDRRLPYSILLHAKIRRGFT